MPGRFGKALVVATHKLFSKGVGCFYRRNTSDSKFFHKPILKRKVGSFDTAFGRACVRADGLDIQFVHCTAKLGLAITTDGIFIVNFEDAGFVAEQSKGLPMLFQVTPCDFKIGECRFRFYKVKLHQQARRFFNIDKSSTGPPVTRLMNFRCALSAWDPESAFYHETSNGFFAKDQTVNFLN